MDSTRIQIYCKKFGYTITDQEFLNGSITLGQEPGCETQITKWDLPICQPTIYDLEKILTHDIQAHEKDKKLKALKENELFGVIERLCIHIGANVVDFL